MLASAAIPAEEVTEQENNLNVAEPSEVPLPHPGGEDLIAGDAAQGGIKKEPDGGIAAGIPKAPAWRRWKGNYRVLDIAACAKAESSNDVKLFRVKEVFPESQLTFPVKEGSTKAVIPEILEEARNRGEAHSRSSENMLAQTPHDNYCALRAGAQCGGCLEL